MPCTEPVDAVADDTIEGGKNVVADETIESGEGVLGPANVDSEQATSDEDGEAASYEAGDATLRLVIADQPIVEGITLLDLTLLSCRWPIGNPRDLTTFRYCGEAAPCGGSYCKRHARLAYPRRKT